MDTGAEIHCDPPPPRTLSSSILSYNIKSYIGIAAHHAHGKAGFCGLRLETLVSEVLELREFIKCIIRSTIRTYI